MNTTDLLMAQHNKAILTIGDIARILDVDPKTLSNRISNGTFPVAYIRYGRFTGVRVQDLADFFDSIVEPSKQCTIRNPRRRM